MRLPGKDWAIEVVLDVAGNEEIEQTVVIIVAPGGAGGPAAESDAGFFGEVCKRAVAIVVIETVLAVVGDVDVRPAVVVVVRGGNAEAPTLVGDAGFLGNVSERAVVIVVEEHCARRGFLPFHRGGGGTVEKIDVQPAVVVVIEKRDAGAGCVEDRGFFGRTGAMVKLVEAGLTSDVEEDDRCAVDEAAGGDGTRL